jgi:hypothetical protein
VRSTSSVLASLAIVAVCALAVGDASAGVVATDKVASQGIRYRFDAFHTGGTVIPDSYKASQPGRVRASNGGRLTAVRHGSGRAVRFPGRCLDQSCPRVVISTSSSSSTDPRWRSFRFGASVKVSPARTSRTSTIVQKGRYAKASRWRLRLNGAAARPYCLVKGSRGLLRMNGAQGLADGRWHNVSCTRSGAHVWITVDGRTVAEKRGPIGRVHNRAPLNIGGTRILPANNQYFGVLDNVTVRMIR